MTRRIFSSIFCAGIVTLAGCQSVSPWNPWRTASTEPQYSAEEIASLDEASADAELRSNEIRTVSQSRPVSEPVSSARVDQLVQAGEKAVVEAGSTDTYKLQEARRLFEEALALDASSGPAHHGLAIVADLQQDWFAAETHYKQALSQKPSDPDLLNDLGYSYLLQNRFHEAGQYLQRAIEVSPRHPRAHLNFALLALKRGDRATAQTRLSTIYSPAEVQQTLAELERDLQLNPQAASPNVVQNPMQWPQNNGLTPSANVVAQANSQSISQQDARPVHVYPAQVASRLQQPNVNNQPATQQTQAPQQMPSHMQHAGQQQQFQPSHMPYQQQPAPQQTAQYGAPAAGNAQGSMNHYQQAGRPNTGGMAMQNAYGQQPSGPQMAQPMSNQGPATAGIPVGSVLSMDPNLPVPGGAQQSPAPGPQARYGMSGNHSQAGLQGRANQGAMVAAPTPQAGIQQAPVLGLNAGPGTLFPISADAGAPQSGYSPDAAQCQQGYCPPGSGGTYNEAAYQQNMAPQNGQSGYPSLTVPQQSQQQQPYGRQQSYGAPQQQYGTQQSYPPQSHMSPAQQQPQYQQPQYQQSMGPAGGAPSGVAPANGGMLSVSHRSPQQPLQTASFVQPQAGPNYGSPAAQTAQQPTPLNAYNQQQQQNLNQQYQQALQQMDGRSVPVPDGQARY